MGNVRENGGFHALVPEVTDVTTTGFKVVMKEFH